LEKDSLETDIEGQTEVGASEPARLRRLPEFLNHIPGSISEEYSTRKDEGGDKPRPYMTRKIR
jgi:hypothetical protein